MYPMADKNKSDNKNPYIDDLVEALEENGCTIVNNGKVSNYGVFDLLLNINKVDGYYFNWIEYIPERRFGFIQTVLFVFIFLILKLFNKKIIWILHDKISHTKKGIFLKVNLFYLMVNYSDYVFTHSKEGIRFGNAFLKKEKQIAFKHHPIKNNLTVKKQVDENIDIMIWGNISPYKGVDTFLEYLKQYDLLEKYTIHIVGHVSDEELRKKLKSFESKNIVIEDKFVSNERLEELFMRTKVVLFTYAGYSTLASAALTDTLAYGKGIIGPEVGAFKDLRDDGLIDTFETFDDLMHRLENGLDDFIEPDQEKIKAFIEDNSWPMYGKWLCNIVSSDILK
jgi:glycosyltransferase involved in cell wall biosynthesis